MQDISYDGILRCWEQGNALLGRYASKLGSVHDPDDYLLDAVSPEDRTARLQHIVEAYQALHELKCKGQVASVGVGAKDWKVCHNASCLHFKHFAQFS